MVGTPAQLFASLEGQRCQGQITLTQGQSEEYGKRPIPVVADWFRKPDGSTWVDFKYGNRRRVPRPVLVTGHDIQFTGVNGQVYGFRGSESDLSGPTSYRPFSDNGSRGTTSLNCAPKLAADAEAVYDIPSKINGQTYRLVVSTPPLPAPPNGYPVLYVLDGHWYYDDFARAALKAIDRRETVPFIVVGVTYPVDSQTEIISRRNYDLTLPLPGPYPFPGRRGGADVFLQFLDQEVKPFVAAHYKVDASNQVLFGHSYAGLTALHELFRNPGAFSAYIVSSPAIWWGDKQVLTDEAAFSQQVREGRIHARILISAADAERAAEVNQAGITVRMLDDASDLASRLKALDAPSTPVSWMIVADANHMSEPLLSADRVVRFAIRAP
jgi:predicted alpha/beta superfamily hydrolase